MFIDMLDHYNIKAREIKAMLQDVTAHLEKCSALADDGWKGESGNAFKIRLDEVRLEADKADEALDDIIGQVSSVISKCI